MKAMLYVDYMSMRQNIKTWLMLFAFFFVLSVMNGQESMILGLVPMLGMFIPTTLFAFDALGWEKLRMTMPISRKNVVSGKFLFLLLTNLASTVICAILVFAIKIINGTMDFAELFGSVGICGAIALVISGILTAAIFKWGVEKGRYIMVACVWIPIMAGMVINKIGVSVDIAPIIDAISATPTYLLFLGAVFAALACYFVCYMIAVRIYQRIEF